MQNIEKKYQIALSFINGIGSINAKKLLAYVGSPEAVFKEKKQNLIKIPGIGEKVANEVFNKEILEKTEGELNFIEKHKISTFFYTDKEYPNRLKQFEDSPIILYFKGQSNLNQQKIISIVGTRKATHEGLENCKKLIEKLSSKGHKLLIVSGLAYGIDIHAHKVALKNEQQTIAVLGHGLNMIYPSAHKNIAKEIIKQGGLLSELPSSAVLDPAHFVKRNRIIAGLADATVVVESIKGGSLITAKIANDYNKDVFAFPGRVNDKYSEGCNFLIKTNQASLIEDADDIEYIMGWTPPEKGKVVQSQLFVELNEDEKNIVNILKENGKTAIDIISLHAKMPVSKVSTILLKLEFAGIVLSFPGKIYSATTQ
ncbi:MAG: DNA-protecting protein DprA [Chloroflexia bacterium]|nr:DNA-protecting protein DprA [Chloroflexia bacterium]